MEYIYGFIINFLIAFFISAGTILLILTGVIYKDWRSRDD